MKLLEDISKSIVDSLGVEVDKVKLDLDATNQHGDLTSNVLLASKSTNSKQDLLLKRLEGLDTVDKAEIAGPGFLNIYLSQIGKQSLLDELLGLNEDSFNDPRNSQAKVQLEYVSANPTGPLTLGNGRGAFGGSALANIYKLLGYDVKREYYINNIGRQAEILADSIITKKDGQPTTYDSDELYKGDYIPKLADKLEYKEGESLADLGSRAAEVVIDNLIKPSLKNTGVKFDSWYKESRLYQEGTVEEALDELEKKDLIYKKDGATWFKSSKFGDEKDRVIRRKNGQYTYFASDIGYAYNKFKQRGFDLVINLWGADHHGYVPRYKGMLEAFGWQDSWIPIVFQLVTLKKDGKVVRMSKREGQYLLLDDLIDEVGSDVARYVFLSKDFNTPLDIDLSKIKQKSKDNPVYYIQYAFARINSIEEKREKIKPEKDRSATKEDLDYGQKETELILELSKFEDVIKSIKKTSQVHLLPNYANDIAKKFHSFYRACPILQSDEKTRGERLKMAKATKNILKISLKLLGIERPEKM